ncbi:MAG TPA: glycosyltransferase family 1 protein, partial [Thermoplasmata archaeon]|nr:glycosyltransferase family 1 protein [Thermoplasmata archaeon]
VVRQYGVPAGKVRVIPNGVWSSKHRPSDMARPDVVAVGRIHERKGFDLLVRAVARSPDALHGHRLTIVGSGEMEASLRALIRSEGVATRVRLAGHLPDDRLRDLLAHARLLVMPSRYEGFGMVMIEGMASGLPVLSTRAGAAPDVIEAGVNGFLVGPDDPTDRSREDEVVEGLSAGLADALSDIDRLRRMGVEARRTVEATYSWDRIAGMTVDVYREAIAARDGPGREGPAGGRR